VRIQPAILPGLASSVRRSTFRLSAGAFALATAVTACSNGAVTLSPAPKITPIPTSANSATGALTTSTTASAALTLGPFAGGYSTTITVPAASTVAHLQFVASLALPAGVPNVMSKGRQPQNVNAANINVFGTIQYTADTNVVLPDAMIVTWLFPLGVTPPDPTHSYVAIYDPNNPVDPNNPTAGWNLIAGPAMTFSGGDPDSAMQKTGFSWVPNAPLTLVAGTTYELALFSTTSTLATPTPLPSSTASPTPSTSPTAKASPSASPSVSPTPSTSPSVSPTPSASPTASPTPAASPTASPTPSASPSPAPSPTGFFVESATASGNGIVDVPLAAGSVGAFAVEATDDTLLAFPNGQIVVNFGSIPLSAQICQTAQNGQCLSSPVSTVNPFFESFTAGETEQFSIFVASQGTPINGAPLSVVFQDDNGNTLGSTSVTIQTVASPTPTPMLRRR